MEDIKERRKEEKEREEKDKRISFPPRSQPTSGKETIPIMIANLSSFCSRNESVFTRETRIEVIDNNNRSWIFKIW